VSAPAAVVVLAGAARALAAVLDGRSADDALAPFAEAPQRAAIHAVALGSMRWYLRLRLLLPRLLARARTPPLLRALLIVGLHQIEYSRNAPELTVSAAVDAARLLHAARATGLVNAVLRRFLRERAPLLAGVDEGTAARSAHPDWLVRALASQWPQDCERILAANNAPAPMTLRVEPAGADAYVAELARAGMAADASLWRPGAVTLRQPVGVYDLPGFDAGRVSVQDAGAQLAAALLDVRDGERVLDACAAPGGKSGALLQTAAIELSAVDSDGARMARLERNLARLRCTARVYVADLRQEPRWWDAQAFDAVLLDAPCSAVGVIRRHPDIKLLRRASDIGPLAEMQLQLLGRCWQLLKPGGRLVYCTCSVLQEENSQVIERFLAASDARIAVPPPHVMLPADIRRCALGLQLLPGGDAGADGFYYACLTRP
jgi:16S rRNA (cytosine967-C5)-methyltransferase